MVPIINTYIHTLTHTHHLASSFPLHRSLGCELLFLLEIYGSLSRHGAFIGAFGGVFGVVGWAWSALCKSCEAWRECLILIEEERGGGVGRKQTQRVVNEEEKEEGRRKRRSR